MNDTKRDHCCVQSEDYLKSIDHTKKETLKNIGCSVECGYSYLTAFGDETLKNLCMYLNLWLDEQKRTHVNVDSGITGDEWNNIEEIWNYLLKNDSNSKCKRETNGHNISHIRERKKLMTYCINRDYIKGLCAPKMRSGDNISPVCDALKNFIERNYATFYENQCINTSVEPRDYRYHISNECTLYNTSKTFPVINLHAKAILDNGNIRTPIKKCEIPPELEHGHNKQTEDGADDLSEFPESSHGLDGSDSDHTKSKDVRLGLESAFLESTVLDLPLSPEVTSLDNKPSKPIYYAGLSALGVVFTSTVLYKV
ncbi:hypothetical protein PVIIG_05841 [Plasmodium vivax India VII]|uniref:VIR protein n=1 Tax=Plasmodium vivax India VII TaxID=1077284 RepID=A0A0J9SHF5_PLAVI|nr:hypothetical protein PVIIG_05841 [Plasmodium vivax India VII]